MDGGGSGEQAGDSGCDTQGFRELELHGNLRVFRSLELEVAPL
jgi:hypothetical protein